MREQELELVVAVAQELGVPPDPRMVEDTAAAMEWVEDRRSLTPPAVVWARPRFRRGAVLYAAHLYRRRAAPMGTDSYADDSMESGYVMAEVYRLVPEQPKVC